ncbi:hypothetical protein Ciccas_009612 [Cichlidogyrus casuarinus]|uniref:Uncharacterized protein n=1 Tax=Cichlidogyrus casuarinus TaxID=1844966 RepID=A0ABD2PWI8_9PLAT
MYLCVRLDPRALCGPISVEDKNMRVGLASLFDLSDQALSLGMPPLNEDDEKLVPLLTSKCSQQTNGVQRWVVSVLRASNLAQLNLLAAAFERSARRATNGGRGVPAFIVGLKIQLCCRGGPDHATMIQGGTQVNYSPFSRCSTCLSPCHLACLVDSRNGQFLSRAKRKPRGRSKLVFEPDVAGHFSLTSSLSSQIHSRLDASGAAFLICDPCKVHAGFSEFTETQTLVDAAQDEEENVSDVENIPDSSDSESVSLNRALSPSASPPAIKVPAQADQKVNLLKAISLAALKEKASPKTETPSRRKPGRPAKSEKLETPEPSPARRTTDKVSRKRKMSPKEVEPEHVISLREDPRQALILLHDLIALPAAKPLKGCGISRSIKAEEESADEEGEKPKLLVNDLNDLVFMADKNILPEGPLQIIPQLKLLLSRWSKENRPGSRLHGCVMELREQLDKKLQIYGYDEVKTASPYKKTRKSALPS